MADSADFITLLMEANFKMRTDWFRVLNKKASPGGIVLVGDSLTQEFPIHEMMDAFGKIHNRGIGGDTSGGLLHRMPESIFDLRPSQVYLLIGTNDLPTLGGDFSPLVGNVKQIIDQTLKACPAARFHLISLYPVNCTHEPGIDPLTVSTRTNVLIDCVNQSYRTLAREKKVEYLDFNRLLKDETGNLRRAYTREGLHLSPLGYEVILRELQKHFKIQ